MQRFYWLIEGVLAGCSRPGGDPRQSPDPSRLEDDLGWLREQGVGAVLTLTETSLDEDALERHDMDVLHIPVPDVTAPYPGQLIEALRFIDRERAQGRAVVAHCLQGQGRTGTVLAAYLVRDGIAPDHAIAQVRDLCDGALGVEEQERAIHAFAARRDWVL